MKVKSNILNAENLLALIIVLCLLVFASTKYSIRSIGFGLILVIGTSIIIGIVVRLYQEFKIFLKTKKWDMTIKSTILFICAIITIGALFALFLPYNLKIYISIITIVVLLALFFFDILRTLFRRT
jgi:hypothetical protein